MVNFDNTSGEPDLPLSVNLSNGSCSAEATELVLDNNEMSYAHKVSAVNGTNADKVPPVKEISPEFMNGMSFNNTPANGKDYQKINGYSKELPVNVDQTVNGNLDKKVSSVNDVRMVVPLLNGNSADKGNNYLNSSSTPSESESCSNVCVPDPSSKEDNSVGYKEVVSKKKRNKNKNRRKKPSPNLPPGICSESIRCDKRDKENNDKISSSPHLSKKPPITNFTALGILEKSYSSVLKNGQTTSQLRNGGADMQNVTKCAISKKSLNSSDLPETSNSVGHLSSDTVKSAVKCEQRNSSTKLQMTVSAQTDTCFQSEVKLAKKDTLPCYEKVHDHEKADCVEDTDFVGEATDESSNAAYCESVGSNDSGRGDSETIYDDHMPYCCEFPKDKVKNLIGRHGSFKNEIESVSGARIWVPYGVFPDRFTTVVAFMGTGAQIEVAKQLIKRRFRHVSLKQWIGPQAAPWLTSGPLLSENFSATLPEGCAFMAVLSCIYTPSYFWLQQWGHPEIHPLEDLENMMSYHFNTVVDAPGVVNPMIGNVVAVPVFVEGENVKWVRGEIIAFVLERGNVMARYLDHGGETQVPMSEIRPMRQEFLSIPFFAAKCSLFGVGVGPWSEEACAEFKRLCDNVAHPPIVYVISHEGSNYAVSISGFDEEISQRVDVANTLIEKGLAPPNVYQVPEPSNAIVQ